MQKQRRREDGLQLQRLGTSLHYMWKQPYHGVTRSTGCESPVSTIWVLRDLNLLHSVYTRRMRHIHGHAGSEVGFRGNTVVENFLTISTAKHRKSRGRCRFQLGCAKTTTPSTCCALESHRTVGARLICNFFACVSPLALMVVLEDLKILRIWALATCCGHRLQSPLGRHEALAIPSGFQRQHRGN